MVQDGRVVGRLGLLEPLLGGQECPKIQQHLRTPRCECQRLPVTGFSLNQVPAMIKDQAQIAMGLGKIGHELDSVPKTGFGGIPITRRHEPVALKKQCFCVGAPLLLGGSVHAAIKTTTGYFFGVFAAAPGFEAAAAGKPRCLTMVCSSVFTLGSTVA